MTNWFEVEFVLLKHLRLQPDVLDKMEFYRVEYLIENWKESIEKENKTRKEQEAEYSKNLDMNSLLRQQKNFMNTYSKTTGLGNIGNFKPPTMPKF